MIDLTETESELVNQLLDILEEAIDSLSEIDESYANKTKIQKLLYFAIDEFEIPVTHSWYLAGAVVPDQSIGPDALQTADGPTGPSSPSVPETDSEDATGNVSTVDPILFTDSSRPEFDSEPSSDLETYVSRSDLLSFYRQEIPDLWHERTMRFLQNFYQETAPDEYRLLYIESTHLRTHLADLVDAIDAFIEGRTPERSIASVRESIGLSISDLHYYIGRHDGLSQTLDIVVEGTNLIEDAVIRLDQHSTADLTPEHRSAIERLQDFFYYYVWKYPCLLISANTASGSQADHLRAEQLAAFEEFDDRVLDERSTISADLASVDLLPAPGDYEPIDDSVLAERLHDLSTQYLE
ncbi:hypothetical protein SAMN05192561_10779 [Halopenitus malekzadehii]|uniref:DUF8098 domain-containing protein n=1 Tax=Halopenitus malekzadehii TaxID=1267564 RepID=A0A1H6J2Y6_9EURY|nr:hypothetical protein [Halopenitus malekzadehii]SEH56430.1 hypothetical protein SAMN05192561_10779 [Halopenitus malekzadehii]